MVTCEQHPDIKQYLLPDGPTQKKIESNQNNINTSNYASSNSS